MRLTQVGRLGATWLVLVGLASPMDVRAQDAVGDAASETSKQLFDQAAKDTSGRRKSEVLGELAREQSRQTLASASGEERRILAAGTYLGFETINTVGRVDWCKSRGVAIDRFVEAFRASNADNQQRAYAILRAAGMEPGQLARQLVPSMGPALEQDMADIMATTRTDAAGACRLLDENAEAVVALLSQALPAEVSAALGEDAKS